MKRRELLLLGGGALAGGGGLLLAQNDWDTQQAVGEAQNATADLTGQTTDGGWGKEFGIFSPGFEKIEFINLHVLRIHFGEHNMDGFGVRHSSLDDVEDDIYGCAAPKSTGTRDVPLSDILRSRDAVYPSYQFDIHAYEGEFSSCSQRFKLRISTESKGSVSFRLPEQIAPRSAFDTS